MTNFRLSIQKRTDIVTIYLNKSLDLGPRRFNLLKQLAVEVNIGAFERNLRRTVKSRQETG